MAHMIQTSDEKIYVKTEGWIFGPERMLIVKKLMALKQIETVKSVIIDHQDAQIDLNLSDAHKLGQKVVQMSLHKPKFEFFIIAPDKNRFIIDVSAMIAIKAGVDFSVCENRNEALKKIFFKRCGETAD